MTTQAIKPEASTKVWVASRGLYDEYHVATTPRTPCNKPTRGYGYLISVAEARENLCRPCAICFPAVLARTRAPR